MRWLSASTIRRPPAYVTDAEVTAAPHGTRLAYGTSMAKPKDVDAYIAAAPTEARPILEELRRIVLTTIPKVEEKISWGVPSIGTTARSVGSRPTRST